MTDRNANRRSRSLVPSILGALVLAGAAAYGIFFHDGSAKGSADAQATQQYSLTQEQIAERANIYKEAEKKGAAMAAEWPKTEDELIRGFWSAIIAGDVDKACLLCPGAKPDDFGMYMKWRPSPPSAIGAPEPHPTQQGVQLRPVTLSFPGYPNKTVKMATMKTSDGRLGIDGRYTIWW